MKILCAAPGPTHSTIDVYNGIVGGLRAIGHQVGEFRTHNRIDHANRCLRLRWEDAGSPADQEPDANNVLFHASSEIVQYALYHEAELVLFVSCGMVHPAVYTMLQRAGVRSALILTESPQEDARQAQIAAGVDVVWTNERTSVLPLREVNQHTYYLRHAHDPEIHRVADLDPWVPMHDVIFVGTLWQERIDLLASIDWTGIDFGIYGSADLFDFERFPNADNKRKRQVLEPYLHVGFVDNERTTALYRAAKIGLNLHRTSVDLASGQHVLGAESMNPRCYEQPATGGALLLTDARKEVAETLDAPTFTCAEELSARMRYYLNHHEERRELVELLRQQIAPHTFRARAAQLDLQLREGSG